MVFFEKKWACRHRKERGEGIPYKGGVKGAGPWQRDSLRGSKAGRVLERDEGWCSNYLPLKNTTLMYLICLGSSQQFVRFLAVPGVFSCCSLV